jgi:signal transduction histidine kinase
MKWIDKLERKLGHHAIHGLMRIIVAFNALVFILYKLNPPYIRVLTFKKDLILQGQVWRLVSYIFIPQLGGFLGSDVLGVVLYLWFLWFMGDGLEAALGAFKLNVFYLLGMAGTTIAAFFFGAYFSSGMLNISLFFAFARFYPDVVIYVFYILPVKIKWMAWISGAFLLYGFVVGGMAYRMAVVAAMVNYLVFFGPEIWQEAGHRTSVAQRRKRFERQSAREEESMHRCSVCNRTEISNPDLDFRVSANGNEYCVEHLPGKSSAT